MNRPLLIAFGLLGWLLPTATQALSQDVQSLFNRNIRYYNREACSGSPASSPGGGGELAYNVADEDKAAAAIDAYVEETAAPQALLRGYGTNFVEAGKQYGVSPLLMVAIAQHESQFASPLIDARSSQPPYHNPFGLTATESQPHTPPLGPSGHIWRIFNSYEEAILAESQYIREEYIDKSINALEPFIHKYAPASDNNKEDVYVQIIRDINAAIIAIDPSAFSSAPSGIATAVAPASENCQTGFSGGGDPNSNKQLGQQMAAARGWTGNEWNCLLELWTRESGWRTDALNATSDGNETPNPDTDAYGIPQSSPGNKMATVGPDWKTNPATQMEWGLNYIGGTYGTPCGALANHDAEGAY